MSKTVLITGASSGLGRATAKKFHAEGWNVIASMRSPEREQEFTTMERILVTRLDVQDRESIGQAVNAGVTAFGRIDALINNAGYGAYGPLEATDFAKIQRQFDVNVLGLLATIQGVLPHFRRQAAGAIVNISSIGGRIAFPLGSLYHGTKFAVEGLTESMQYELEPLGIRVKLVEPGGIKTDFAGRSFDFSNDHGMAEYQPLVAALFRVLGPMMEQGSAPEQIAEVVYAATVDTSNQLRYEAGSDALQILAQRRAVSDAAFFDGMRAQFATPA